ncbi:hypothetical protein MXB_3021 [Myxobolus squamalis]|nr:hypothetical protein MXB_3021 [Myxobolus squamalis]
MNQTFETDDVRSPVKEFKTALDFSSSINDFIYPDTDVTHSFNQSVSDLNCWAVNRFEILVNELKSNIKSINSDVTFNFHVGIDANSS